MVKSVVGEEIQLKSAEDRLYQSGIATQVGLIIGKVNPGSDRGFFYDLIPTPPTDGGGPACSLRSEAGSRDDKKKGQKGGKPSTEPQPTLSIDGDWIAEHARQVSRMLLGGMNVVGVYIWASEASFKATPPSLLSQTIRGVAQAAAWYDNEFNERLLMHISYSPRRWACRSCTLTSGNLRPCDFKMGKLLSSLQTFRCMYNFEIRLPIFQVGALDSNIFKNVLRSGIGRHAKELQSAKALIDGNLVAEDQPSTSEGLHTVELLLPFMKGASVEACSTEEVAGLVVFSGAICASAYLGPKEPISQAISDLKGDIISSLRSRLDIITDEEEGEVDLRVNDGREESSEISVEKPIHQLVLHELRKPLRLYFPRRVLVPWLAGVFICDYLQPSETFEEMMDRCKEMMSMEAPIETSALLELETEATSATATSFWDVIHGEISSQFANGSKSGEHSTEKEGGGVVSKGGNLNFLAAIFILVLALLVGWAITVFFRPVNEAR